MSSAAAPPPALAERVIEDLLKRTGIPGTRAEGADFPTWTLRIGSATVAVQAAGEHLVVSANLAQIVSDDAALYDQLLNANVRQRGAFFALDKRGVVSVCQMRSAHGVTEKVFRFLVGNVGRVADEWDDRLRALKS
jgi:hypothetical protein